MASDQYRVVGFIVQPSSREITLDAEGNANCDTDRPVVLSDTYATEVIYTYSVEWKVPSLHTYSLMIVFLYKMGYEMG